MRVAYGVGVDGIATYCLFQHRELENWRASKHTGFAESWSEIYCRVRLFWSYLCFPISHFGCQGSIPGQPMYVEWMELHWHGFFSKHLHSSLSVPFHWSSILVHSSVTIAIIY